jgi:hypothetical protein
MLADVVGSAHKNSAEGLGRIAGWVLAATIGLYLHRRTFGTRAKEIRFASKQPLRGRSDGSPPMRDDFPGLRFTDGGWFSEHRTSQVKWQPERAAVAAALCGMVFWIVVGYLLVLIF